MKATRLDEVAVVAAEQPTMENLATVIEALKAVHGELDDSGKEAVELMFETWGDRIEKEETFVSFVFDFCRYVQRAPQSVRYALGSIIKTQLPPYLAKASYQRSLGLKDRNIPVAEVIERYYTLLHLAPKLYCWQTGSKAWGKIINIDELTGTVIISSIAETSTYRVPLDIALSSFRLFKDTSNVRRMVEPQKKDSFTSIAWKTIATQNALFDIAKFDFEELARSIYIPRLMNLDQFTAWWNNAATGTTKSSNETGRQPGNSRSLFELKVLLAEKMDAGEYQLPEEQSIQLVAFFNKQRPITQAKEISLLAEIICRLAEVSTAKQLKEMLEGAKDKIPFWPSNSNNAIELQQLEIWGMISAKQLPFMLKAVSSVYSFDYLASFAGLLPLKAIATVFATIEPQQILNAVQAVPYYSSDLLVWIWRNRKSVDASLMRLLTMENIVSAMILSNLPKPWLLAQRELKKLVIDDSNILKVVVDNAGEDVKSIIFAVNKARGFNQGEQQSLLVKLARHSTELRDILNGGEGRKMMNAKNVEPEQKVQTIEPIITSLKSFKKRSADLDELINKLVPENRKAIEEARAHGDFRENAEYDAAKERRRYLTNQRTMWEQDVMNAQPIDFRTVHPDDVVIVGSTVCVKIANKEVEYYITGAWDGNPEKRLMAYKTPIGMALMGHKVGSSVKFPDGTEGSVTKISSLPEWILADLDA